MIFVIRSTYFGKDYVWKDYIILKDSASHMLNVNRMKFFI